MLSNALELEGKAGAPAAGRALERDEEVIMISVALRLKGTGFQAEKRSPTSSRLMDDVMELDPVPSQETPGP